MIHGVNTIKTAIAKCNIFPALLNYTKTIVVKEYVSLRDRAIYLPRLD